jgi:transcription elongation factor GreA
MTTDRSAAGLLRAVGLMADGPVPWGRALPPTGPGVFVIELAGPLASAPLDLQRIGKWIERVDGLRLDGERPTSRALRERLASFWLPSQPVLYIGGSEVSASRRVAAIAATVLGDRRPHAGGHWLHALKLPVDTHVWWAATSALEEYEDALLSAFAAGVPPAELARLPDRNVVLPFAVLRRPTGERKATGVTGALILDPPTTPPPPTRVIHLPDGDADGANGEPPAPRRRAATASGTASTRPRATSAAAKRAAAGAGAPGSTGSEPMPTHPVAEAITPEGAARLQAELDELTKVKRPGVIGRIRAAKELGDLKENADYTAAREEQSFLEGRVQAIEARLRTAIIVDVPDAGARIGLGSKVTVSVDDEEVTYEIVGASDADVAAGRISSASPVGRALVGREAGDDVAVRTPAGEQIYRIVEVA